MNDSENKSKIFTEFTDEELADKVEEFFKLGEKHRDDGINNYLNHLNLVLNQLKEIVASKREILTRLERKANYLIIISAALIPILLINFEKFNLVPWIFFVLLFLLLLLFFCCMFVFWPVASPRISEYAIKSPQPGNYKQNLLLIFAFYRENIKYHQASDLSLERVIRSKSRANLFAYIFLIDFIICFFLYFLFSYYELLNFLIYSLPVLIVIIPIIIFFWTKRKKNQLISETQTK